MVARLVTRHRGRVRFACPLCDQAFRREVTVIAELDFTTPIVTVADLSGCPHARAFGSIGHLTAVQEARLIGACLEAYETTRREPDRDCRCAGE
jgi:hypothetical protein